ncbi:MAG: cytochrome c3 family protein [Myxococcales bacterium]
MAVARRWSGFRSPTAIALRLAVTLLMPALTAGCAARAPEAAGSRTKSGAADSAAEPRVSSNILRRDYAGSEACGACHGEVMSAWRRSPMHRMTRLPERTEVHAPFDGREFHFKGDVARLEQVDGLRFVRLTARDGTTHLYRVTKVIGGRYREDFAGLEVPPSDPAGAPLGNSRAEILLPVSYVFQNDSLRLKGYSVMVGERPGLRAGGVWNQTCIFCHNTVPYFDDLWGALHGPGAPGYQGEVVDRVLPSALRLRYSVTDPDALVRAVDEEISILSEAGTGRGAASDADSRAHLRAAMQVSRARFGPSHFIEVGIGCESCHGGSREHVDDPRLHPTFEPRAPFLEVRHGGGDGEASGAGARTGASASTPVSPAEWQNRACARCHQVLFSRYNRTWEGGDRRRPAEAGGSHITSGEARDFLLGGCARAMACSTCHDPHGEDRPEALARLATPAGNGVCTGCHQQLARPAALQAHAHHDPSGVGGSCVGCHMPRKNMGLGYQLTRYHRIGSPTDAARVEHDRPLECALCHADRTVGGLLADIGRLWGKHYDSAAILRLYGSLDANVLIATIERGYAHEQAAAMGAAGAQRFKAAGPAIARAVPVNAYPLVRYHGAAALAAIDGRPLPSDLDGAIGVHGAAAAAAAAATVTGDRENDED